MTRALPPSIDTDADTFVSAPDQPTERLARGFLSGLAQPLKYRDYRLLFAGQFVSGIGDGFFAVALPWLILSHVGGPQALGLVLGANGITRALSTIVGGWLSDRIRPRRVMLIADTARVLLVSAFAAVSFSGHAQLGVLCALSAAAGIFSGAFIPASFAMTPEILPDEALGAGNSLSFTYMSLAALIGTGLAGIVVARGSTSAAFALDALSFIVSALTLWAMRPARPHAPNTNIDTSATQAVDTVQPALSFWRFVGGSQLFQLILVVVIAINLVLNGVIEVGLPAFAHGSLQAGATGYGLLLAIWGGGALLGGLAGSLLTRWPRQGILISSLFALQGMAMVFLPLSGMLVGALAAAGAMGLFNGLGNVCFSTMVQKLLPRELMGRMMGAIAFCNFGLNPVSVTLAGFAAARYGASAVVMISGALSVLVMLLAVTPRALRSI